MPKFAVYEHVEYYHYRGHQFAYRRATFNRTPVLLGKIDAYFTVFLCPGGMGDPSLYLDVPGCPDSRLTAREAVELAKAGRYGLRWEPAVVASGIGGAR